MSVGSINSPSSFNVNLQTLGVGTPNMDKLRAEIAHLVAEFKDKSKDLETKQENLANLRANNPRPTQKAEGQSDEDFKAAQEAWDTSTGADIASLESSIETLQGELVELTNKINAKKGEQTSAADADNRLQQQWAKQEEQKANAAGPANTGVTAQFSDDSQEHVKAEEQKIAEKYVSNKFHNPPGTLPID